MRLRNSWFLLLLATSAPAQWLENDPAAVHPERLLVKLAEGSGAQLRDGELISRTGADLASVRDLFATAAVAPLITAVPWEELDRWHRHAAAVLPAHNRPGHLGLWFRLTGNSPAAATELLAALQADPWVTHCYYEPRCAPAAAAPAAPVAAVPSDIPPTTPLFTHLQLTHGPPPGGHGIRATSGVFGARGQGVRLVMIEQSWVLDHEDVSQLVAGKFLGPVAPLDWTFARHGTSGASMICADRNGYGLTGVADEVDMRFAGMTVHGTFENCVALAIANTGPGDGILAVLITQVPLLGPGAWVPIEYFQSAFDATLTATALERHVVAAGGNGNLSLDDPVFLNRFNRAVRDSGAILVAASQGAAMARAPWSNWGSRIDAHSWGEGVASCAYGTEFLPNGDERQAYTANANGTSASTPQLGGLVAAIQGAARRQLGQPLTNAQLLSVLHAHGAQTPDAIGRRTDLVAAFASLGISDGLRTSTPDVLLTQQMVVTVEGPVGTIAALFGSSVPADVPVGFNRNAHIDPGQSVLVAAFAVGANGSTWTLTVPNDASLRGIDFYFQALRVPPNGPWNLTNSCQVTIL